MPHPALLAVSHGTGNPHGQAAVARLVDAVAARLPDVEVRLAHVDVQDPDVATALRELRGPTVIVPLLLSAGYHVHVDLHGAAADRVDVVIAPALGPDRRLASVLAHRLPRESAHVVLAAAGSSDERANDDCRATAALLSAELGREVSIGFLAAAEPSLEAAIAAAPAAPASASVSVASYLLAPGYFHDLATRRAGAARVTPPLLTDDEPPQELVELLVERYRSAAV